MVFGNSYLSHHDLERKASLSGLRLDPKFSIGDWFEKLMNRGKTYPSLIPVPMVCLEKGHRIMRTVSTVRWGCLECSKRTNEKTTQLIFQEILGGKWRKKRVIELFPNAPKDSNVDLPKMYFDHYVEVLTIGSILDSLERNGFISKVPQSDVPESKREIEIIPVGESDAKQHEDNGEGFLY
mgnify:CR=1 FL=1